MPHSPTSLPTDKLLSVSYRELQNIYCILPHSPMSLPTDKRPSVSYREWQNIYCICHNHWRTYRRHHRCTLQIPMRATVRVPGRSVRLPTDSPTNFAIPMCVCSNTSISTELPTEIENSGGISTNFGEKFKIYRRKLPTKFNATAKKNIILSSVGKIAV